MQPAPPSTPPPQKRTPAPPPQPPPADAQRPASQDGSTAGDNTTAQQAPRPPPGSKPSTAAADQTQRTTAPRRAAAYESNSSGVTASRLPVGGALALARRASEVQQDVEFFQQVAQELPDCPALQSLLYTHRNVIGDGPTCDELLASVESRLAEWNATRRECIATERAAAESLKKARLQEAEAAEANRQREIEATIARMQSCFNEVSAIDQHQRQRDVDSIARERQALEARHAEERKAVEQYCQTLDRFEAERKRRIMEIDHADARGAVETQETLQRSLKLSEEEHARIDVAHRFADARERVRLVEEALDGRVVVLRHEEAAVVDLRAWFEHLAQRCNHQTQLRKLKQTLLDQCSDNEHAARAVLRVDEERDFESIYVASIEVGVSSPSRRRQQQQQQQAESPTHV